VKLIHSLDEGKPVLGLTTLNNELYVRRETWPYNEKDNDDIITIYDTETYRVQRSLKISGLGGVDDMTSCNRHQCIYISDWKNKVVHRVESKNIITQWPVNDEPRGLSVNSVHNVLVTCGLVRKIKEFTTDGKLIREIQLPTDIVNPKHTVELINDQFVVCHGASKDPVHRVCIVDSKGCILQSYGGFRESYLRLFIKRAFYNGPESGKLNTPVRLSLNRYIFVADLNNDRILMLSPNLTFNRTVVSDLTGPRRLRFDEQTGRLYIADNKWENGKYVSGVIKVYGV
jgi:DNA-binding beta-propeller fold protein YncE